MSEEHLHAEYIPPPDTAAGMRKHVQDRLNVLEKNGQCPVCNTTQWALLNGHDGTPQKPATPLPGWPTYALACGHCGFVRHHLRSIFDGNETLGAPGNGSSRVAGGDGGGSYGFTLEARVAVLEKMAASTEDLLAELRWDLKAVRSRQEEDYRSSTDRISDQSEKLAETISGSTLRLYVAGGLAVVSVLATMAKGFRWF